MQIKDVLTGIQHLGLPTRDFENSLKFYEGLGFTVKWRAEKFPLCFLELGNIMIEMMQRDTANQVWGAWDHITLNVTDIDKAYEAAVEAGYNIVEGQDGPRSLPFFENGVRYFTIEGPNKEKIEFNQIL